MVNWRRMPPVVAILEDDSGRIDEMRACLAGVLPGAECIFFDRADEMLAWLGQHLSNILLISLDHDLPLRGPVGQSIDPGTGRQVADYLASIRPPKCPGIVHSSNEPCAQGMFFALKQAGWPCSRVVPYDDRAWIAASWSEEVRRYLRDVWSGTALKDREPTP